MATAKDIALYVEYEDTPERLPRVVSPHGVPKLNAKGVEIANDMRGEGDKLFIFAEPVAIVGLEGDGRYIVQVGAHTRMFIDPEIDNYFL